MLSIISIIFNFIVLSNIIYTKFLQKFFTPRINVSQNSINPNELNLLIGESVEGLPIYIPEKSLYQNMLITGGIGTGKTASAMYPFTKQLIKYKYDNPKEKLGFLILDVKGNYYSKVKEFAEEYHSQNDVIVIELNGDYTYNPLDKPNLKASILANRIKTILLLFSPNNSESYWLDKSEQVIENFITFCRMYNNGYVTFEELHKLITDKKYYLDKLHFFNKPIIFYTFLNYIKWFIY